MKKFLKELRALRIIMGVVTVFISLMSRFKGEEVYSSGWEMVPSLIAPAVAPILFFVIWLDVLMTWVFRIDAQGAERARLGRALVYDLSLVALLTLSWIGFFLSLAE